MRTLFRFPARSTFVLLFGAFGFAASCTPGAAPFVAPSPPPDVYSDVHSAAVPGTDAPSADAPIADVQDGDREAWVAATLNGMTLEEKVSQLFSSYAYAHFKSEDDPAYRRLVDLVERFGVGGIIFFQGDPMEQAVLANELQARAKHPLLVSQDMEWGAGMRIDRATSVPRAMAFGATRNPDYAYAAGYATAQEARALGVHQIFAPVADVNNNPRNPIINVRSYGERPDLVADMVSAFVKGAQDGGVIATAKHFPGHGDTATDSHAALPVLPHRRARLDALELVPFRGRPRERRDERDDRPPRPARDRARYGRPGLALAARHDRVVAGGDGLRRPRRHRRAEHAGRDPAVRHRRSGGARPRSGGRYAPLHH